MDFQELIKSYLEDNLNDKSKQIFEQQLLSNDPKIEIAITTFFENSQNEFSYDLFLEKRSQIKHKSFDRDNISIPQLTNTSNQPSILERLVLLQTINDKDDFFELMDDLKFDSLLRQYIEGDLDPFTQVELEEVLEREDADFKKEFNEFLSYLTKEKQAQYSEKRNNVKAQRINLLHILENYSEDQAMPLDDLIIMDYLSGFLVKKDTEIIHQIIAKHPSIATFVANQKMLLDELNTSYKKESNLRDLIKEATTQLPKDTIKDEFQNKNTGLQEQQKSTATGKEIKLNKNNKPKINWWAIAATIVIILFAGIYLLRPTPLDYNQLYVQYHEKEELLALELLKQVGNSGIASTAHPQAALKRPLQLYNAGRYPESITGFNDFLKPNPNDLEAKFFLALAYQENHQLQKAQSILEDLIQSKNIWKDKAMFHLAMIYLTNDSTVSEAKSIFTKISTMTDAYYKKDAINILKKL